MAAALAVSGACAALAQPAQLTTVREVLNAVGACYKPPPLDGGQLGIQITVHFALKRDGELLGHPRITYESGNASDDLRLRYRIAIMKALETCTPLPLSETLGAAIAGRPFRLSFNDRRNHPVERKI